ncbi:SDR family oxidoreductase [Mycolicibacterium baixiangningiae]|uniref:SDR family oxidoreductase n=1 Tax=Mycolicibacterium baixiangningiae TaxID=2761578 RepID=UPI00186798DC|nr:SDR family oxidoreductase [Mycolicibacterium baixiangningiae]
MTDVAIVTGAAGGIGAACALRLAADGFHVIAADLDLNGAQATADRAAESGNHMQPFRLDVTSRDDWQECVAAAAKAGRVAALLNNAGILRDKSLLKLTDDDWQAVIDVHLKGAFLGTQAVFGHMKEAGGSIVSVSSTSERGSYGQANYSAAKGGIVSLTRTVALEGARFNIRANAIAPGAVNTRMIQGLSQEIRERFLAGIPVGRFAEPSEMAGVVSFLCSSDSSYVTGQLITADGGATLGG